MFAHVVRGAVPMAGSVLVLPVAATTATPASAQDPPLARALSGLEARELGPAIMGGRVADLDVVAGAP